MTNVEARMTREARITKSENPMIEIEFGLWSLVIGICLSFGAWDLGFACHLVLGDWDLFGI
jgi:hypothetical protein